MYLEEFPNCCGISVITDLNSVGNQAEPTYDGNGEPVEPTILQELRASISAVGRVLKLATTNSDQRDAIKALKKTGFKKLKRFRNPNSGNFVTIWSKA